jgi:hypothetical protein
MFLKKSTGKGYYAIPSGNSCRPAQESVMHLEVIYSLMWLIKPKKYNNSQYYADKPFGGTFQKKVLVDEK